MKNFVPDYWRFSVYGKETHGYFIKIQEEFMRMNTIKWHRFYLWAIENFNPKFEINERKLVRSLYYQLIQCQKHFDPSIPRSKRKYIYEIPAWHSVDGERKTYEFSYWLRK